MVALENGGPVVDIMVDPWVHWGTGEVWVDVVTVGWWMLWGTEEILVDFIMVLIWGTHEVGVGVMMVSCAPEAGNYQVCLCYCILIGTHSSPQIPIQATLNPKPGVVDSSQRRLAELSMECGPKVAIQYRESTNAPLDMSELEERFLRASDPHLKACRTGAALLSVGVPVLVPDGSPPGFGTGTEKTEVCIALKSTYDWMDRVKGPFLVAKRVLTYPGLLRALASEALSLSLPLSSMLPFLPTQTCLFVSRSSASEEAIYLVPCTTIFR